MAFTKVQVVADKEPNTVMRKGIECIVVAVKLISENGKIFSDFKAYFDNEGNEIK